MKISSSIPSTRTNPKPFCVAINVPVHTLSAKGLIFPFRSACTFPSVINSSITLLNTFLSFAGTCNTIAISFAFIGRYSFDEINCKIISFLLSNSSLFIMLPHFFLLPSKDIHSLEAPQCSLLSGCKLTFVTCNKSVFCYMYCLLLFLLV